MSGLKWALIVGLGLAVTPVAAQAQNGPSFNVIVNPQAQQAVPRRGPARDDYRGYRDNDRRYRAEDRRNSAYYRDRDHRDARRGPPAHAPAHGYRRKHETQSREIAPGFYLVTPRN